MASMKNVASVGCKPQQRLGQARAPFGCGLLSLLVTTVAVAAETSSPHRNNFEITPFIGVMGGGKFRDGADTIDRDVKSDTDYGLIFNADADSYERQYEVLYARQSSEVEGLTPLDIDIQYLHIGGLVNFTDTSPYVVPFFGLTIGATRFKPDATGLDTATKLSFSAGGGLKIPVTNHIGIRLDARAFVTAMNGKADVFCASGSSGGTCLIRAQSDTFVQYSLGLGVIAGF